MWFLSACKSRSTVLSRGNSFRPQVEALEDRCLLSAGALDPSFGTGGFVNGPAGFIANTLIVNLADGRILCGGSLSSGSTNKLALVRYNPNGSLDTTFEPNHDGLVSTAVGVSNSAARGLALQSDGKIVAAGYATYKDTRLITDTEFATVRYNSDGSLDKTFGGTGIVVTNVVPATSKNAGADSASAVAIQGDGRIVVTGDALYGSGLIGTSSHRDFTLIRYNVNGTLDTTFGPDRNGIVDTPNFGNLSDSPYALAVQPDGRIFVGGSAYTNTSSVMAVVRYTSAGLVDTSFGTDGQGHALVAPPGISQAGTFGMLVQSDGAAVIAGYCYVGTFEEQLVARLSSNGQLDPNFGSGGFTMNANMVNAHNVVQSGNGDLLTAGSASPVHKNYDVSDDFGVAAFLPGNGTLDPTFGSGGTATIPRDGEDMAQALGVQPDGKIVVAGAYYDTSSQFLMARLLPPNTKMG